MVNIFISIFFFIGFTVYYKNRFKKKFENKLVLGVEEAIKTERLRIGTELHDSTIQRLHAVKMRLDRSLLYNLRPEIVDELTICKREIENEIKFIRNLIENELATQIVREKFSEAVCKFCQSVDGLMNWKMFFDNINPEKEFKIAAFSQLELLKICQQLIQNSFSHGLGDKIYVTLKWEDKLFITVEDNGGGYLGVKKGLGTLSIQTRAEKVGAKIKSKSYSRGVKTILVYEKQQFPTKGF